MVFKTQLKNIKKVKEEVESNSIEVVASEDDVDELMIKEAKKKIDEAFKKHM